MVEVILGYNGRCMMLTAHVWEIGKQMRQEVVPYEPEGLPPREMIHPRRSMMLNCRGVGEEAPYRHPLLKP